MIKQMGRDIIPVSIRDATSVGPRGQLWSVISIKFTKEVIPFNVHAVLQRGILIRGSSTKERVARMGPSDVICACINVTFAGT